MSRRPKPPLDRQGDRCACRFAGKTCRDAEMKTHRGARGEREYGRMAFVHPGLDDCPVGGDIR